MTYNEMIAKVKEDIKAGKKLHSWELDIAIDLALDEMENNEEK